VTNLPSHFEMGLPHIRGLKHVRLALGLHPLFAERHTEEELQSFNRLLQKTSYVGEIGLDNSREGKATFKQQLSSFRFVLASIQDQPRFITLHSRGAESEVLNTLQEFKIMNAVFHWYSGPISLINEII